jgi:hypothetical protein
MRPARCVCVHTAGTRPSLTAGTAIHKSQLFETRLLHTKVKPLAAHTGLALMILTSN